MKSAIVGLHPNGERKTEAERRRGKTARQKEQDSYV